MKPAAALASGATSVPALLIQAAAEESHRRPRPAERLFRVIDALERSMLPSEEDRRWLLDALHAYVDGDGAQPLGKLLGVEQSHKGRGTAIAKERLRYRDRHYWLQMEIHVAAGYPELQAAELVVKLLARAIRAPLVIEGQEVQLPRQVRNAPPILNAETLARRYRKWSKEAEFATRRELARAVHAAEIERLRATRTKTAT